MIITLEFNVDKDDLEEATVSLLGDASINPEVNLVDLVQYTMYDSIDGSQLLGQFNVKKGYTYE